jgi:hypothetical protein
MRICHTIVKSSANETQTYFKQACKQTSSNAAIKIVTTAPKVDIPSSGFVAQKVIGLHLCTRASV